MSNFVVLRYSYILTNVSVLNIPPRPSFRLDNVMCLLRQVSDEHFRCDGDGKGCIVRAVTNVFIGMYDLLHACDFVVSAWRLITSNVFPCNTAVSAGLLVVLTRQ